MMGMYARMAYVAAISILVIVSHSASRIDAADVTQGQWGPWGPVSPCSVTCGSGTAVMERIWIPGKNDPPSKEIYTSTQVFQCSDQKYPECPQNGTWSGWGVWSGCTMPCGGGIRERHRECRGQLHGGRPCEGERFHKEDCNREPCPPLPRGFDMSQCDIDANFTCDSKQMCIPLNQKCDNTVHCHDGSDEKDCPILRLIWGNNIRYDLSMGRNSGRSKYSSSIGHLFIHLVFATNVIWMLH